MSRISRRLVVPVAIASAVASVYLLNGMLSTVSAEEAKGTIVKSRQLAANAPKSGGNDEIAGILPAPLEPREVAQRVDALIDAELKQGKITPAPLTTDEDFLRRVTFDLAGTTPEPNVVSLFGLDPDKSKRSKTIDRLLDSADYARNWSQYWREVIY